MLNNKAGLWLLLGLVFAVNYLETAAETSMRDSAAPVSESAYKVADAVQRFEPAFVNFEYHDATNRLAVYAYSISYFFLFPLLGLAVALALTFREETAPLRVFCLAIAIDYLVSFPFYLFFPVPERWAYPDSGAILLSDLWSSKLIEALRPISGLDNCFPSSHVSLTIIFILASYLFQFRFRNCALALGLTVILSTFVLGIHWLADILAGLAAGGFSVALAWRFTETAENWRPTWEATG